MDGYGALEIGAHRFCDVKAKRCDGTSGVGKFIHLWQNSGGAMEKHARHQLRPCARCEMMRLAEPLRPSSRLCCQVLGA